MRLGHVLIASIALAAMPANVQSAESQPQLRISIVNNFRVFKNQRSQQQHLRDYCRYLACGALRHGSTTTEAMLAPEQLCGAVLSDTPSHRRTAYRGPDNRIHCADHRVRKGLWNPNDEPLDSHWSHDTYSYDASSLTSNTRNIEIEATGTKNGDICSIKVQHEEYGTEFEFNGPCSPLPIVPLRTSEKPHTFSLSISNRQPSFQTSPKSVLLADHMILALGDSISAGEGMPHRLLEHDIFRPEQWWERRCHRSYFNFSTLATAVAAEQRPDNSFTYFNFACSGATISNRLCNGRITGCDHGGLVSRYLGYFGNHEHKSSKIEWRRMKRFAHPSQFDGNSELVLLPSQIASAKAVLDQWQDASGQSRRPDYVVLTIGGNDVLFNGLLKQSLFRSGCSISWKTWFARRLGFDNTPSDVCMLEEAERHLPKLSKELWLLKNRMSSLNPKNVLLVGYLDPTHAEDDTSCNDSASNLRRKLGPNLATRLGFAIDAKEAERAYRNILKRLNLHIRAFTNSVASTSSNADTKWRYVDPYIIKKAGRRGWCANDSWFINYEESIAKQHEQGGTAHPNIYGQNWLSWLVRCELAKDKVLNWELVCQSDPRGQYSVSDCSCKPPT